jgi:serine/threonine-protein kinase
LNETRWNKAKQIVAEALEMATDRRTEFVVRACGTDEALRREVEQLLAADDEAARFLEEPTFVDPLAPPPVEGPGTVIGPYKILQELGEGGFGIVYMAEQQEPVKRKVALKIIKLGMDTRQVIARFEAERQALAMMDHPNIAKVLDAGATDSGRPFFVMELVRGIPITEYCDSNNLSTNERLQLFVPVCQAVQHAHQKGIIHRDVKPSNVLVTLHDGKPVPKVIDFGIAKATNQQLTEKTVFTAFRQFIGTPEYMSPEQAEMSGLDIDTRTDIYSLGVLLYELLTGTTPFGSKLLREAAYGEVQRIIREVEPDRPSTRLSTMGEQLTSVARHRRAEPRILSRMLRGDLDWIVMKALEKDRTRRYETPSGLAADIERHLADEPVLAGPPGAAYRLRKFARRHKRMAALLPTSGTGLSRPSSAPSPCATS